MTGTPHSILTSCKVGRPDIDAFFRRSHRVIIPLTVKSILEGDLAQKLA